MNDSRTQGTRCYEKLKVVDDMNDSGLRVKGSRYYGELRVMVDMKDFRC